MNQAPIGSVNRAFDIIETIQIRNGAGVSELAGELNMAKSTIHDHLQTLTKRGYLTQDDDDQYHLSLYFLTLGGAVRRSRTIFDHVEPLLAEIAEETGESTNYVVESQGDLTFVGSAVGEEGVRTEVDVGFRTELHTVPEGRLVLAHLPEERRKTLLDRIDFPVANNVGRASFVAELEDLKETGVASGNKTIVKNFSSVSVPVVDNQNHFYGAVVVAGPSLRFTDERIESITETLQYTVSRLNISLSYESQASVVENQIRTSNQ